MTPPDTAPQLPPAQGNTLEAMAGFLSSLGLTRPETRDTIEESVAAELSARGLNARVLSVRYGVATLVTDPQTATLLRYDTQPILEAVNARLERPLTSLVVRSSAVAA